MTLGWAPAAGVHGLSRSTLRRLLLQFAPTPADFDRLCIDYAPQVRARFSSGMDRLTQTNLLLRLLPPREILAGLAEITGNPTSLQQCLREIASDARNARECEQEALSLRLEEHLIERDRLRCTRADLHTAELDALNRQIVEIKRQIRRGPQLNSGEILAERYILCELIGRGGYGDVWQALDRRRQQFVALKVLHGRREDPRSVERFFRGARIMRQLAHPHIVRVLEEPADHEDFHYYVMDYLAGGDLERALKEGRIGRADALKAVLQAGEALQYAHACGLVHRDVKPQNILLDSEGQAHLTDFDLVLAEDSTGGTATGAFIGTVLYVAPEVLDDSGAADARSDVYALGMSLLFVLYGRPLPRSGSRDSLLDGCPGAPAELLAIARCATASQPGLRYPQATEFCDALRAALLSFDERGLASAIAAPPRSQAVTLRLPNGVPNSSTATPSSSETGASGLSASQRSYSFTGFALPPPPRSLWRRTLTQSLLGGLALAALAAGYRYTRPTQPQPPAGSAALDSEPPGVGTLTRRVAIPPAVPTMAAAESRDHRGALTPKRTAPADRPSEPTFPRITTMALAGDIDRILSQPRAASPDGGSAPGRFIQPSSAAASVLRSDVSARLGQAQTAYLNREYQRAIDLAMSVRGHSPVLAWRIVGNSACQMEDQHLAGTAYANLDGPSQKYMKSLCELHHLVLSGDEFVRLIAR